MIRHKTILIVSTGILVAIFASGLALYDAGFLGMQQVITGSAQANPWNTEFMTKGPITIFEGTVKSTETKTVYEPPIMEGDKIVFADRDVPYNYVTIQVTEWLKDPTGEYPDHIIVRDYTTGAVGKVDGEPVWFSDRDTVGYFTGEKGIFFAEVIDGELTTHGSLQVFRYDNAGRVYLPYFVDSMEPFDADEFKAEIRANS